MRIVVAGNGKVGAALVRQLAAEGHNLTLIDARQEVLETSVDRYDVMTVHGNCACMSVLRQAGVKRADLLIALTGRDEINLLCCLTARVLNKDLHTIARIRNPEYLDQVYGMQEVFALSMVVCPERQAATEIERLLRYPGFLRRDTFAKGRVEIVELRVDGKSKLRNVALTDLNGIVKCKTLVCAVVRDGKGITPDGNFVIREGDRLFVTAPTDVLAVLLKNLGIITRRVRQVLICGGGRVSYYLAERLEKCGISAKIIERDPERSHSLAALLPRTTVIDGDASDHEFLESQRIRDCDAVVTLTGLDEMNMIVSLYADFCGVPHVVTKIGRMETSNIPTNLPLGSVLSPKELCCSSIVRYVRAMHNQAGAAISIHPIADGYAEALEFRVERGTPHCGVPLRRLKVKHNVLIVCINHGAQTQIPDGDACFNAGDTIVVVKSGSQVIYQLNDIFE